jgi:hypothetical protein
MNVLIRRSPDPLLVHDADVVSAIRFWWREGRDTQQIGRLLRLSEAVIYNTRAFEQRALVLPSRRPPNQEAAP